MTTDADHGQVGASAAEVYEEFFVPALFGQWPPALLDAAGVQPGDRVLDVGCGTGVAARAAVGRVGHAGSVVGVDPNPGMLAVARRSTDAVTWRDGAAERLPLADGSVDRVLCQFALMFFADRPAAVAEMARVLAPGGRAAVATWSAVGESPGYAAMVDLLDRLFGREAADALRAPFCLGEPAAVRALLEPVFADVTVARHEGTARFASVEAWVHTDIRGWTLADMIDDEQHAELLAAAQVELARFTDGEGRVAFAAPALIGAATRA
jgi:ubiquinone/menaquinone biosynthesis C-methylase UbiE